MKPDKSLLHSKKPRSQPDVPSPAVEEAEELLKIGGVLGYGRLNDSLVFYLSDPSVAAQIPATIAGKPVVTEVTGTVKALSIP